MSTIRANPNLASQAPIASRIILIKIDSDDVLISVIGISITSLSINASNDSNDINK